MNRIFGIIGNPLIHSFSPQYFQQKFVKEKIEEVQFHSFPLSSIENFPQLIENKKDLCGLAVTIPYKETVIPYLNYIDSNAKSIGAVNCIAIQKTEKSKLLYGFNTDILGFEKILLPVLNPKYNRALILGTGGASKAVAFILHKLEIPFQFVSRIKSDNNLTYNELSEELIRENNLIINTTPVGMYPNIDEMPPIPYHFLSHKHTLIDLIYNPLQTHFMEEGIKHNAKAINGLQMLYLQAEENWKIWNSPQFTSIH